MKLIESILVATDFSAAADGAVQCGAMLARHFKSRICLVHVNPDGAGLSGMSAPDPRIAMPLQAAAQGLRFHGVQVQAVLASGDASEQIARHADQHDVNAVVIGAGHSAADGRFQLGSTAERVRRRTDKPVWMVKPGTSLRIGRLLCPVDLSAASARALRNAIHLGRQLGAELNVLTVISRLASYGESSLAWYNDLSRGEERGHLAAWSRFLSQFDFEGVSWTIAARQGRPQQQIVSAAREIQADLLIMGSGGYSGLKGWILGGVARWVARELPCSMLTVRSNEPIQLRAATATRMDPRACAARSEDSLCPRFQYGQELLALGFPEQAVTHFQECVAEFGLCPRAWTSLAAAQRRLGQQRKAEECELRAEYVLRKLSERQIQAEVRGQHLLYRPMFGIK